MNGEPAWKTYLKVGIALIPTLFFWLFFLIIVFPKVVFLWDKAGIGTDGQNAPSAAVRLFIGMSYFAVHNFYPIVVIVLLCLTILELWVRPWPRLRRRTCIIAAVLLNALVLLGITVTTVSLAVVADRFSRGS